MKLVLCGVSYRNCPVELREKLALGPELQRAVLKKMHAQEQVAEAAVLETCNRIEFYLYVAKDFDCDNYLCGLIEQIKPAAIETWRRYRTESTGRDVVRHLFEVAAGLDSQMLGENQVLSQVKSAYKLACDCRTSRFVFHRLFHNAFRAGKAVRTHTDINCGAVSVSLAAVELARSKLDLPRCSAMLIGAGENAELAARYLLKAGLKSLLIANRNPQTARAMAARLKIGSVVGLDDIADALAQVDLVVSSTAAEQPIVTSESAGPILADRNRPLLMIDIAVPRDIDPQVAQFDCVELVNIDDLDQQVRANKRKRGSEIPRARKITKEFTDKFINWYDSLDVVPLIAQLTRKGVELARSEARRYAKDFTESDRQKLELFAESLVRKMLHGPISYLKDNHEETGPQQLEVAELINKMFLSQDKPNE